MVTSSAVVGSSAISSFGWQAIAMAIITRWLMPPESWCGKAVSRRLGRRDADLAQELDGAGVALALAHVEMRLQRLGRAGSRR